MKFDQYLDKIQLIYKQNNIQVKLKYNKIRFEQNSSEIRLRFI